MQILLRRLSTTSALLAGLVALLGATATNTMTPKANVTSTCSISKVANNALGAYDPVVVNRTVDLQEAVGVLALACTRGAPGVTISLDLGLNAVGTSRYMARGAGSLEYDLYSDPTYSTPWNLTSLYTFNSTTFAKTTVTVYTDVPAGQDVPTNGSNYTDTVTATVNF